MKKSWKRKFLTISIGQMASLIGSSAVQFSLIWWIASETGSPIMMGLSGLAAFLPATLLSLLPESSRTGIIENIFVFWQIYLLDSAQWSLPSCYGNMTCQYGRR